MMLRPGLRLPGGVAARMARRELARHKGRSALVVALVMLPVMVVNVLALFAVRQYSHPSGPEFAGGVAYVTQLIDADGSCRQHDETTAQCSFPDDKRPEKTIASDWSAVDALPGRKVAETIGVGKVTVDGGDFDVAIAAVDFTAPGLERRYARATSGLPADDQVVLTRETAERFGLKAGDELGVNGKAYRVAGTVLAESMYFSSTGAATGIVVGPQHPLARAVTADPKAQRFVFLYDHLPAGAELDQLNAKGLGIASRAAFDRMNTDPGQNTMQLILVGVAMIASVLTATIAGAAFAIGIRQQRRGLALLSATGAPGRVLQRVLVGQGTLLGLLGGVLGTAVGVGGGLALVAWVDSRATILPYPVVHSPAVIIGGVLVATLAGTVAAWLPARQVAKQDVLTAVRDSEAPQHAARLPRLGLVLLVLAAVAGIVGPRVWPVGYQQDPQLTPVETVIGPGAVCTLLLFGGLLMCVPWLLDRLARLGSRGPLPLRMALRDGSRNRSRATACVAASLAITALFSLPLVIFASEGQTQIDHYSSTYVPGVASFALQADPTDPATPAKPLPAGQVKLQEELVATHIGAVQQRADLVEPIACTKDEGCMNAAWVQQVPVCRADGGCSSSWANLAVFSPEVFRMMTGRDPDATVVAHIEAGGVLVPKGYEKDGKAHLSGTYSADDPGHDLPALAPEAFTSSTFGQGYGLIGRETVSELFPKASLTATQRLLATGVVPSQRQLDDLQRAQQQAKVTQAIYVEQGPHSSDEQLVTWFGRIGALAMLVVAAITSLLALHDARDSQRKLAAVGATTWTLRTMNAVQTLVSVGLGGVLGMLLGTLPLVAMIAATRGGMSLGIPWGWLLGLAVGVPVAAALVSLLVSRPPAPRAVRVD